MPELFVLNHFSVVLGNSLLSSFHIYVPHFSLISSSSGNMFGCSNRGAECSFFPLDSIVRTVFLLDVLKQPRLEVEVQLQFIKL